ncbi:hypothetical protein [uncultured Parabacteroides sp.]|jgi:ribosome-associated translation inhibitor RaiA|uniref:hypothetical protein n=1 Tax=uncultured Parabacteroides sp. TaxID=512312 RepID=UPI00205F7649|nr:hypothetical protein [uncultured Parabacteroides sp.]DAJ56805.1 MAG TPA: hypothetical protein [Caudoviricetes sp.]
MTKREAKILALEVFADSADILIEMDCVSGAIRSTKDCNLINIAFNELASSLKRRADKLKSKKI